MAASHYNGVVAALVLYPPVTGSPPEWPYKFKVNLKNTVSSLLGAQGRGVPPEAFVEATRRRRAILNL